MTPKPSGRLLRAFLTHVFAAASGYLIYLAFPPRTWWFLAPIGVAGLILAIVLGTTGLPRRRKRRAFGIGFVGGLGFYVPYLPWIGEFVGTVPWIGLAVCCALFVGLFGIGAAYAARLPWRPLPIAPLGIALAWMVPEAILQRWPFGGFPWGRLAFSQPDGPLVFLAALGGAPLLSFGVALSAAGLAAAVVAVLPAAGVGAAIPTHGVASAGVGVRGLAALGGAVLLILVPLGVAWQARSIGASGSSTGSLTIVAIQGDADAPGWEFGHDRARVLRNHVDETLRVAAKVKAGLLPRPDVVLWPENASDLDALHDPVARDWIDEAARAIDAPIVLGTVVRNADGTTANSVIVWEAARGPGERHDKKFIQPFGEYMPYRSLFRLFSEHVDAAGNFVAGHGDGVVRGAGVPIGVATCFEVVFDAAFRDAVRGGAEILVTPTNNATFGWTEMTWQQLAMSRVRAVEHDRSVVTAATSGVSAIITRDGTIDQHTALYEPAHLVAKLPLRGTLTPAARAGTMPEAALCVFAVLSIGVGALRAYRGRRDLDEETDVDLQSADRRHEPVNAGKEDHPV